MFSHSKMSSYEQCPRKYAFRYIEKPDIEERQTVEAFMGKAVHEALEKLYLSVQMERTPKWEEIRDFFEDYWEKNWRNDILIVRSEFTGDDYRNIGRRCLQEYFVGNYPFAQSRVLALEEHLVYALDDDGRYKIQGYIDRLAEREDGTIEIHDYKTARRLPSQDDLARDRQLALYQIGIEKRWDHVRSVALIWHYLRANRSMTVVRTRESLDELCRDTMRLIDSIESATARHEFPPRESELCDWCEYQSICPAKKHLFATAALTPQEFSADRGVQLVDRFVAAARRHEAAKQELDLARQEVIDFAATNSLTRLQGHNAGVGISRRVESSLPPATDPNRAILESLIQASGRWEAVSDLSRSKLPKALQGDLFAPDVRAQIVSLLVPSEIVVVTKRLQSGGDADDGPDI